MSENRETNLSTKRLALVATLSLATLTSTTAMAQQSNTGDPARAMLVLDASGSMWGRVQGVEKIAVARRVIGGLMRNWNQDIHLGLSAYGHRRKGDCSDIQTLAPVGPNTAGRVASIVNSISPKGKTPLSEAVRRAAEEIRYTEAPATVILVTDGLETCQADPCAVARALEEKGVDFTAHVIGFDITEEESRGVRCVAELTGGEYHSARTAEDLRKALESTTQASLPKPIEVTPAPAPEPKKVADQVRLALVEGGPLLVASDLQMPLGTSHKDADIRMFADDGDGNVTGNQLRQQYGWASAVDNTVGRQVVSVKLGQLDVKSSINVTNDGSQHVVNLNGAIVKIKPIVAKGVLSLSNNIKWTVHPGNSTEVRALTSQLDHGPGGLFVVRPGKYTIHGQISGVKKSVVVDLAAGDQKTIEVDMRSGTLNLQALLAEGGAASNGRYGNFRWLAFAPRADGSRGDQLTSAYGSRPRFELPVGDNIIVFEDKVVKHEFKVNIAAEQTHNVQLPINAGTMEFQVVDASGNVVRGYPQLGVYPRGADKNRPSPFGFLGNTGPRGTNYIPAGPVDVVVKFKGKTYSYPVDIAAGEAQLIKFKVNN
ncbi:MAG: VWA domain-containing protein [Rhizobiaceae bacterium]